MNSALILVNKDPRESERLRSDKVPPIYKLTVFVAFIPLT